MSKKMIYVSLLLLIIVPFFISASDPSFYIKKSDWHATMWASINSLEKMEPLGKAKGMPDFGGSNFTIMVWVKTKADRATIYAKMARQSQRPEYQGKVLYIEDGTLKFQIESIGILNSEYVINDGKWHHVVLAGKDPCAFYIDGKKIKELYLENHSDLIPDGTELRVRFGYSQWRFPFRRPVSFDGIMDELKIYSRKLSSDEIRSVYDDASSVENGLAGWWQFEKIIDEDGDKFIVDSSPYRNNGQIYNCDLVKGKMGTGLLFSDDSRVLMSRSAGLTSRNLLWNLLARDFSSASDISEMEIERRELIWNDYFSEQGIQKIATSYAERTRDFSNLKKQVSELAGSVSTVDDLGAVWKLYHLSIISQNLYTDMQKKIKSTELAVRHLKDQYGPVYPKGNEYLNTLKTFSDQTDQLLENPSDSDFIKNLDKNFEEFQ
jgi:hypothetical protein